MLATLVWAEVAVALLKQTCTQNYGATHLVIDRRLLIKESQAKQVYKEDY